jgi:hypothetical protein
MSDCLAGHGIELESGLCFQETVDAESGNRHIRSLYPSFLSTSCSSNCPTFNHCLFSGLPYTHQFLRSKRNFENVARKILANAPTGAEAMRAVISMSKWSPNSQSLGQETVPTDVVINAIHNDDEYWGGSDDERLMFESV